MRWLLLALLTFGGQLAAKPDLNLERLPANTWVNTDRALNNQDVRGKVVILDFWTYGCVNCVHVIDDLHQLQADFGDQLAVIAVHSPKFDNEKRLNKVRQITKRYQRKHPVVNDVAFSLWRSYGVRAWPTFVVFDTQGQYRGQLSGEGHYATLKAAVTEIIKEAKSEGLALNTAPLPVMLDAIDPSKLQAPGKVLATQKGVFVSDTLNNRIVWLNSDLTLKSLITAEPGVLNQPQGLALVDDTLYIANTGGHTVLSYHLKNATFTTLAGTGELGRELARGKQGLATALRSPWDLALDGDSLYIASSGTHQIWRYQRSTGRLYNYAGSGREDLTDGALASSAFSQPSGLALNNGTLYVADSEDSAVRAIDMEQEMVSTLVGEGLFEFGDKNGYFKRARIQHPKGVAVWSDERIFIADTYNHKVKTLNLAKRKIATLTLKHDAINTRLDEPGGISVYNGTLYIADTNHDRVLQVDENGQILAEISALNVVD